MIKLIEFETGVTYWVREADIARIQYPAFGGVSMTVRHADGHVLSSRSFGDFAIAGVSRVHLKDGTTVLVKGIGVGPYMEVATMGE